MGTLQHFFQLNSICYNTHIGSVRRRDGADRVAEPGLISLLNHSLGVLEKIPSKKSQAGVEDKGEVFVDLPTLPPDG